MRGLWRGRAVEHGLCLEPEVANVRLCTGRPKIYFQPTMYYRDADVLVRRPDLRISKTRRWQWRRRRRCMLNAGQLLVGKAVQLPLPPPLPPLPVSQLRSTTRVVHKIINIVELLYKFMRSPPGLHGACGQRPNRGRAPLCILRMCRPRIPPANQPHPPAHTRSTTIVKCAYLVIKKNQGAVTSSALATHVAAPRLYVVGGGVISVTGRRISRKTRRKRERARLPT